MKKTFSILFVLLVALLFACLFIISLFDGNIHACTISFFSTLTFIYITKEIFICG